MADPIGPSLINIKASMPGLRTINLSHFLPSMKPFSNIRTKRSTTFAVLLVCLFAITSGIVNACVLEARSTHSRESPIPQPFAEKEAAAISAGQTGVIASHGVDSDPSRAPCLKVCDDGSQSVAKTKLGADSADPGPAPFVGLVWTVAASPLLTPRPAHPLQSPGPSVPLRVRFARLTL